MKKINHLLFVIFLASLFNSGLIAKALAADQIKVVYHMVDGLDQATRGMGNIRNHLRADPTAKIVVVSNGDGVKFMLAGAKERGGKPFDSQVSELAAKGVEFRVCANTLAAHDIPASMLLPEAKVVPAGVVEVARLQAQEHFAYIRP